jgi:hypothetical protein
MPTKTKTPAKSTPNLRNAKLPFAPREPARPFVDPHILSRRADPKVVSKGAATIRDVQRSYAKPAKQSPSNVLGDPTQSLQTFTLTDLAQYTKEAAYSTIASKDVHLFYVGRDDVHDILKYILSRVTISLYLNMFGFDDSELNNILMQKALNPAVTMLITLDSSHQISHTKGFVADGRVAAEGSTNWSTSGEGTFVVNGKPGGAGYVAQNNTQSVITDPDTIVRFQTELIAEHMTAQSQQQGSSTPTAKQLPLATKTTG